MDTILTVERVVDANLYNLNGGSKRGEIHMGYDELCAAIGPPCFVNDGNDEYPDDANKTDVCWLLKTPTGDYITVWNYKNGPAYNDGEGLTLSDIGRFSFCMDPMKPEVVDALPFKVTGR